MEIIYEQDKKNSYSYV